MGNNVFHEEREKLAGRSLYKSDAELADLHAKITSMRHELGLPPLSLELARRRTALSLIAEIEGSNARIVGRSCRVCTKSKGVK